MDLRYTFIALLTAVLIPLYANSAPSIVVDSFVAVQENGTTEVTVSLDQYDSDVAITVVDGSGDADLTVSPKSFTLSSSNPSQVLAISAAGDADSENGTQTFQLVAGNAADATLTAQEIDNSPQRESIVPLVAIVTPGLVLEGKSNTNTVSVQLTKDPLAPVTLFITRTSGDADITVQSSIILNSANWNASTNYLTIASAEDDSDVEDDTAEFTINASELAAPTIFTVMATDDDIMVTINVIGHGAVHGDGIQDLEDSPLTITAIPHVAEEFIEWAGPDADKIDDTGSMITVITAVDDITIEARFTENYDPDDDGCAMNSGGLTNLVPVLLLIAGLLLCRTFLRREAA